MVALRLQLKSADPCRALSSPFVPRASDARCSVSNTALVRAAPEPMPGSTRQASIRHAMPRDATACPRDRGSSAGGDVLFADARARIAPRRTRGDWWGDWSG